MIASGDQRGAFNVAAHANARDGDDLVADKADDAGNGDPQQSRDRLQVNQAVDRLVSRDRGAKEDDLGDEDLGQVLHTAEAVGEGLTGLAPRQHEGDSQGMVVVASPTLWMASESRTIDPVAPMWPPRLSHPQRPPRRLPRRFPRSPLELRTLLRVSFAR